MAAVPGPRPRGFAVSYSFSLLGGLAILAGFFLPWYDLGGLAPRGYDVREGFILLGIGIVVVGMAIYGMISRWGWLRVLHVLAAAGGLVVGIWQGIDIARLADLWGVAFVDICRLGIPAILGGSIVVGISSSVSLRRRRR